MSKFGPYDTQWLTTADFEPTAGRRLRKRVVLLAAGLLAASVLAASSGYLGNWLGSPVQIAAMKQRNASLTEQLEHARVELEVERATRAELERQAEDLSSQVNELTQQLEFVTSRNPRVAQAR